MLMSASKKIQKAHKLSSTKNSKLVNRYQAMSLQVSNTTQETSNASNHNVKKSKISTDAKMLVRAQKYAPAFRMPTKPLNWKRATVQSAKKQQCSLRPKLLVTIPLMDEVNTQI